MPAFSDNPRRSASTELLDTMRAWSAAHPQATFAEIEVEAQRQEAALRTELVTAALATAAPTEAPPCAVCGQTMVRNGTRRRTIVTSNQERVTIHGPRYRCRPAGPSFPPG